MLVDVLQIGSGVHQHRRVKEALLIGIQQNKWTVVELMGIAALRIVFDVDAGERVADVDLRTCPERDGAYAGAALARIEIDVLAGIGIDILAFTPFPFGRRIV